jgi:Domain of unknown function (DUF4450)
MRVITAYNGIRCCAMLMYLLSFAARAQQPTKYTAIGGFITGHNLGSYNNRPLYCNNTDAFILTGDKPLMRLVWTPYLFGSFMAAVEHAGKRKWLVDCSSITMQYRGNMTTWVITDSLKNFPVVRLSVIPLSGAVGMAICAHIEKTGKGDQLVWVYGGAGYKAEGSLSWKYDITGNAEMGSRGFNAGDAAGNKVALRNGKFFVGPLIDTNKIISGAYGTVSQNAHSSVTIEGSCSADSGMNIEDARKIVSGRDLESQLDRSGPLVTGKIPLDKSDDYIYWCIKPFDTHKNDTLKSSPQAAWNKGMERINELHNRIIVHTPDEKLNTLASVSSSVTDGVWYDPVYVHGGMLWNIPFPGWRTIFGGTMYGWHERVKKEAKYYIGYQNKDSSKKFALPDTSLLYTLQHKDSRFYGRGHIDKDQFFYNFQSQFFDQLITEWRSTGDTALENILGPALELHLKWEEECFDPDGDGVYESYINTWPTDCQWYHGGGTAEETSYAFKAHAAALEMAMRQGNSRSVAYHRKKLRLIRNGFFSKLWIAAKGYSGAYREQGGYQRLHEDPWSYSIFLPIDVNLVDHEQAVGSLYYTKWALQNDLMKSGGRRVWTSAWVPGIPTVRELYNGDNYHLALAYFLSGMGDEGYDILKGTFYEGAFNGKVPGDLGSSNGGTDFNDCSSMFARVLVEGLFGYRPNYPAGKVIVAPRFPKEWDQASIKTPDVGFSYSVRQQTIHAAVHLSRQAVIDFYLPIPFSGIKRVSVNEKQIKWKLIPGYGHSLLHLKIARTSDAAINVEANDALERAEPVVLKKNIGDTLQISVSDGSITGIHDPQKVFDSAAVLRGVLYGTISNNAGHHTFFVDVVRYNMPQKLVVYLDISDKDAAEKERARSVHHIPANARWNSINIITEFNADVRTIFRQRYLSPRLNTVSARVGTDGYSPWTFLFWKYGAPEVKLDSVQDLLKDSCLLTKQGVPFYWNGGDRNIVFTSLWDNWPREAAIPVNREGKAVWLLVAGSTNPMQCHIANAIVVFHYADQSRDTLELVPPVNYWSLCPYDIKSPSPGVVSRGDYTSEVDRFVVPKPWPQTVQLGQNCRAILVSRNLKPGVRLERISLHARSQEVVVGLMGVTIMK